MNFLRRENKVKDYVKAIVELPTEPISRVFGLDRGKAIDRVYIEKFLEKYKEHIRGNVLEIAENTYTLRYGEDRVKESCILHVNGVGKNAIKGNLETGEGMGDNSFDSMIITQTLMFLADAGSAVSHIYRALKQGGTALLTVAGISQVSRYDDDRWGHYIGFYETGIRKLCAQIFGEENVGIEVYGNVKTATAMLYGLCSEDLHLSDFEVHDRDYPVIIGISLYKA